VAPSFLGLPAATGTAGDQVQHAITTGMLCINVSRAYVLQRDPPRPAIKGRPSLCLLRWTLPAALRCWARHPLITSPGTGLILACTPQHDRRYDMQALQVQYAMTCATGDHSRYDMHQRVQQVITAGMMYNTRSLRVCHASTCDHCR
jgi:hypothetical protein